MRKSLLERFESIVKKVAAVLHILYDILKNIGKALGKPLEGKSKSKTAYSLKKEAYLRRMENLRRNTFIVFVFVSVLVVGISEAGVTSTQDQQSSTSPLEPKNSANNVTCKTHPGCNTLCDTQDTPHGTINLVKQGD